MKKSDIISKQRVKDFGEVFTPSHLVKKMCDLVEKQCCEDATTFFEPSCGTGNFLSEILSRKLHNIASQYEETDVATKRFYTALSSIYGVDIQADNVEYCQGRLFELFKVMANGEGVPFYPQLVSLILVSNIRKGDALKDTVSFAKVDFGDDEIITDGQVKFSYFAFNLAKAESQYLVSVSVPIKL